MTSTFQAGWSDVEDYLKRLYSSINIVQDITITHGMEATEAGYFIWNKKMYVALLVDTTWGQVPEDRAAAYERELARDFWLKGKHPSYSLSVMVNGRQSWNMDLEEKFFPPALEVGAGLLRANPLMLLLILGLILWLVLK